MQVWVSRTFEEASHEVSKLLNVSVTEKFPICRIPRCRFYVYSLLELDMSVFTSIILKVYANELRISTKFICGAKFQLEKTSCLSSCFYRPNHASFGYRWVIPLMIVVRVDCKDLCVDRLCLCLCWLCISLVMYIFMYIVEICDFSISEICDFSWLFECIFVGRDFYPYVFQTVSRNSSPMGLLLPGGERVACAWKKFPLGSTYTCFFTPLSKGALRDWVSSGRNVTILFFFNHGLVCVLLNPAWFASFFYPEQCFSLTDFSRFLTANGAHNLDYVNYMVHKCRLCRSPRN